MGRAPCCDKASVKKGPWSPEEDAKLKSYIEEHGTGGNWIALPHKIGLKRCGKSCRLRWLNYLRPNLKRGSFTEEEDKIICSLYISIGSRWSIIAAQLPGRTDNDIKNYWNTRLKKKLLGKPRTFISQSRCLAANDQTHEEINGINRKMLAQSLSSSSADLERMRLQILQLQGLHSPCCITTLNYGLSSTFPCETSMQTQDHELIEAQYRDAFDQIKPETHSSSMSAPPNMQAGIDQSAELLGFHQSDNLQSGATFSTIDHEIPNRSPAHCGLLHREDQQRMADMYYYYYCNKESMNSWPWMCNGDGDIEEKPSPESWNSASTLQLRDALLLDYHVKLYDI